MRRTILLIIAIALLMAAPMAIGANADDEVWIPTAGHGPGAEGSFWVTDVYIMNPNEDPVSVMITFLRLGVDNSATEGELFEIEAGSVLVLNDIVADLSEEETVFGALQIEVSEDEGDEEEMIVLLQEDETAEDYFEGDTPIMVYARVYDSGGEGTRGQALEGFTSQSAISAGSASPSTRIIGVSHNASYRSNWFGINISQDENEDPVAAEVVVDLLDAAGGLVGSMTHVIPPRSPIFGSVADLGANVDDGILRFTMESGTAIFGASKIDNVSNDGTTLESFWKSIDPGARAYTDTFNTGTCTWSATGFNPYFPLQPGIRLVLEAEDEGEIEQVIIEVTDQTRMVDGVMTRVLVETESIDGELTEISTNYFAECSETRDVYYFGEDVDIYEDGEVVSHDGAWLAGENDNRPGIIMPGGSPLMGSRYFQEVAPEVALDRAEHVAIGQTIETAAATFENCLVALDTNALEPTEGGDPKAYCPGVGLVRDEDLELVEMTIP